MPQKVFELTVIDFFEILLDLTLQQNKNPSYLMQYETKLFCQKFITKVQLLFSECYLFLIYLFTS